ncbi:MAG: serine hydrolase, partial [Pseudomonadales bacterium]|nr:serine hydrolase [Pseudomonadales bacterium]
MNMQKALSALVVMLGVSVGTSHSLLAQSEITARIDGIVEDYISEGNFHGSLLVASSEGVIYTASYGAANHEWDIPNSLDTKYRIASLTKAFTSVLVFQLIQENKLSLEGTISDYLPSYREDTGRQVSIHH